MPAERLVAGRPWRATLGLVARSCRMTEALRVVRTPFLVETRFVTARRSAWATERVVRTTGVRRTTEGRELALRSWLAGVPRTVAALRVGAERVTVEREVRAVLLDTRGVRDTVGRACVGREVLALACVGREVLARACVGREVLARACVGREVLARACVGREVLARLLDLAALRVADPFPPGRALRAARPEERAACASPETSISAATTRINTLFAFIAISFQAVLTHLYYRFDDCQLRHARLPVG